MTKTKSKTNDFLSLSLHPTNKNALIICLMLTSTVELYLSDFGVVMYFTLGKEKCITPVRLMTAASSVCDPKHR